MRTVCLLPQEQIILWRASWYIRICMNPKSQWYVSSELHSCFSVWILEFAHLSWTQIGCNQQQRYFDIQLLFNDSLTSSQAKTFILWTLPYAFITYEQLILLPFIVLKEFFQVETCAEISNHCYKTANIRMPLPVASFWPHVYLI